MNFSISFGDKKITAEHMQQEMNDINSQKEFLENIKDENGNSNIVLKEEVKEKLGIGMSKEAKKCEKCNKENLERENSKLREFATYNVINTDAKSILHTIYNENYIDSNIFKSRIIQGYKKRNRKNIKFNKKDIDKIAQNKYITIFEGLIFLNIIEPSEDDKIIKLTKYGKQFVEKYIEKKEVV